MSDTPSEDKQPVAPGIVAAMRNVRHAGHLNHRHRHRWSLPSDRAASAESADDEH